MSQSCIRRIEIHFNFLRPFKERWLPGCAVGLRVSTQLGDMMIICSVSLSECTLPVSSVLPASVRGFSEALLWHTMWTIRTLWAHLQLGLWASMEHHVGPEQNWSTEVIHLGKTVLYTWVDVRCLGNLAMIPNFSGLKSEKSGQLQDEYIRTVDNTWINPVWSLMVQKKKVAREGRLTSAEMNSLSWEVVPRDTNSWTNNCKAAKWPLVCSIVTH